MDSKRTKNSREMEQSVQEWMPTGWKNKAEIPDGGNNETVPGNEEGTIPEDLQEPARVTTRRAGSKQRKESLEQYRETFLQVPKLEDRKPVFVSRETRDRLDEIVRKLGGRRMSVSGFIENLARHHLGLYLEDVENWKKL